MLSSPYQPGPRWLRGSLHIHSSFSRCGWHNMDELALAYRDYDFIAITDHDRVTEQTEALRGSVVLRGVEVSGDRHMVLVNEAPPISEPVDSVFSTAHYGGLAQSVAARGGVAVASHPMREYGQHWSVDELVVTPGLTGLEVFSGDGIHVDQDVGFSLWDQVLSRGRRLWGFGNDDFHHWGQERRVWNMVNARDNTPGAILQAMRAGDFYISTGFGYERIETEGDTVVFRLWDDTPQFQSAYKYLTLFGRNGRVLAEKTGRFDRLEYRSRGDEGYIRAEAYMNGGYGAFSQPIHIE